MVVMKARLLVALCGSMLLSPVLADEQPGGQTIAGGFEKHDKAQNTGEWFGLFDCRGGCAIPACVSVKTKNDGLIQIEVSGSFSHYNLTGKDKSTTLCRPDVSKVQAQCLTSSGDCEYWWRMDQIGPMFAFDPNDPGEPVDEP